MWLILNFMYILWLCIHWITYCFRVSLSSLSSLLRGNKHSHTRNQCPGFITSTTIPVTKWSPQWGCAFLSEVQPVSTVDRASQWTYSTSGDHCSLQIHVRTPRLCSDSELCALPGDLLDIFIWYCIVVSYCTGHFLLQLFVTLTLPAYHITFMLVPTVS